MNLKSYGEALDWLARTNEDRQFTDPFITLSSQLYSTVSTESTECPICLEEFSKKDRVTVTNCKHVMHHKCLIVWEETTCPMCRQITRPSDDGEARK